VLVNVLEVEGEEEIFVRSELQVGYWHDGDRLETVLCARVGEGEDLLECLAEEASERFGEVMPKTGK
jgi:hypothetical protein